MKKNPAINYYYTAPYGGPGAATAPAGMVASYRSSKSSFGPLIWIVLLGGAAFAGYWFLYRAKYAENAMLDYTDGATQIHYQVTSLKFNVSGFARYYVLTNQATGATVEKKCSEVDGDAKYQQIS